MRVGAMMSVLMLLPALSSAALGLQAAKRDPTDLGMPFERWTTADRLGRTITFYLTRMPQGSTGRLPVALFIGGSGCQSAFRKVGDRVGGGLHGLLYEEARGRIRVMVVEKPGVRYLDAPPKPGGVDGARKEFLEEHTLPRWAEANVAAVRAAWTMPDVDASRTLVVGHSEGGLVAARVGAELPQVTHVASLAGGGPSQLFDMVELFSRPRPGAGADQPGRTRESVYADWQKILEDPDSTTKLWLGHPYRRWSSFLKTSVVEELLRAKARVYLAQGTEDANQTVASFDVALAELRARGRDVTAERIEGADHGFRPTGAPPGPPTEMRALFGRILKWFAAHKANRGGGDVHVSVAPCPAEPRSSDGMIAAMHEGR